MRHHLHVLNGLAACAVTVAAACGTTAPATVVDASTRPTVLRYLHGPTTEGPEEQHLRLDRLRSYLQRELGVTVELHKTSAGYGVAIEAMRSKKVDVAPFGPFGYTVAAEKAGAEAIVVRGSRAGGIGPYRGLILVARQSPYHSIDDLLAHAKRASIAFVDPASTSGYLIQYAFLQSRGLKPETAFKKTMFAASHVAGVLALVAGRVDAAAAMESTLTTLAKSGALRTDDVRVLWTSPPMPSSPIAVRKDLPESFKREIQAAFLDLPERDPELWRMWPKQPGEDDHVFLPATDATFEEVRTIARAVEHLNVALQ